MRIHEVAGIRHAQHSSGLRRFILLFEQPSRQEIRWHQLDDFLCLQIRIQGSVIVLPLQFFEVEARVSLPDAMVAADALPNPCPHLLSALLCVLILREAVELAAANETRIAFPAARSLFFGAKRMEVKHRFIIFQRVNIDLTAVFQLYAEHRWLLPFIGAYFTLAPFALGFLV